MNLFLSIITLIVFIGNLSAQDNQWVARNNGLDNRQVYCLAQPADNPDVLFAGTEQGLYRSANAGGQWSQVHNATSRSVWVSPNGQTVMFAFSQGSRSDGIWISRNGGQEFNVLSWMMYPYALAVNPNNFNHVFVGTRDNGFTYTLDGQNWNSANNGLPGGTIFHLSLKNIGDRTHLFASTSRGVYSCVVGNNIQWSSIGPRNLPIGQTALSYDEDEGLFAGTNDQSDSDGLYYSDNLGQNWDVLRWCHQVQAVETQPGMVVFASREIGVLRSTNNGENWMEMNSELPNTNITDLIVCRSNDAYICYAANNGGGILAYRIPAEGEPPSPFALLSPVDGSILSRAPVNFRWEVSDDPDGAVTYAWWIRRGDDSLSVGDIEETEIAVNLNEMRINWRHNDEGEWWVTASEGDDVVECTERFNFTIRNQPPGQFELLEPANGDTIFNRETLFRWEPSFDPDGEVAYLWVLDIESGRYFVDNIDTTVYISNLDTLQPGALAMWSVLAVSQGDTVPCRFSFTFRVKQSPRPPLPFNLLHPANDTTIMVERAGGDRITLVWQASIDPDQEDTVRYHLYMDEDGWQVYTFELFDTSFTFNTFEYLHAGGCVMSQVEWYVVAVSGTDSIECNQHFTFLAAGEGYVDDKDSPLPADYQMLTIHPNPFNDSVVLTVDVQRPGLMRLEIIDARGSVCTRLVSDKWINPGVSRYEWDARNFAAGTYSARLTLGQTMEVKQLVLLK